MPHFFAGIPWSRAVCGSTGQLSVAVAAHQRLCKGTMRRKPNRYTEGSDEEYTNELTDVSRDPDGPGYTAGETDGAVVECEDCRAGYAEERGVCVVCGGWTTGVDS